MPRPSDRTQAISNKRASQPQRTVAHDGFEYRGQLYMPHNNLQHHEIAFRQLTASQTTRLIILAAIIGLGILIDWRITLVVIIATLTGLYFLDLLFNLFLISRSLQKMPEVHVSAKELRDVPGREWPTYTILCPLYHESAVLPQFIEAMAKLDYDHTKLQILLLLEEDDTQTRQAVTEMQLDKKPFEVVVVPHSVPKTKPKACNYGLLRATGDYIVIYDAEDIPDPKQLKKAYIAFKKLDDTVVCVQSKLNFYNPHHNLLTRAFTAEYSTWFDLVLTGLQSLKAPIPLGGTSNHFKTQALRDLGGWDAFNVTEDADLGMRLARHGYRTAMIDSVTLEEANSSFRNWFWQRTRWVKGYIQTYLVHSRRHHKDAPSHYKWRPHHGTIFRLIIGGKIFMMFINPLLWILTVSYFALHGTVGDTVESLYPTPILYLGCISLLLGNFLYMYYYMIGCAKRGHYALIKYVFLVPVYWLAMSAAAWYALYEVFVRPHHWSKTKHGLHLGKHDIAEDIRSALFSVHGGEPAPQAVRADEEGNRRE